MTPDELAKWFDVSPDGLTLRVLVNGHQRFSVNASGVSISDRDYPPEAYGNHGLYVDGRVCIQTAPSTHPPEDTTDLSATGSAPLSAALSVQATNISDRVVANFWAGDLVPDDGFDAIAVLVSTADAHRPSSKNVGVRVDAVNYPVGARAALDAREFGGGPVVPGFPYPGDGWVIDAQRLFEPLKPGFSYLFVGRTLYDIGANTNNRPPGDYQFYLEKHLAEAKA